MLFYLAKDELIFKIGLFFTELSSNFTDAYYIIVNTINGEHLLQWGKGNLHQKIVYQSKREMICKLKKY